MTGKDFEEDRAISLQLAGADARYPAHLVERFRFQFRHVGKRPVVKDDIGRKPLLSCEFIPSFPEKGEEGIVRPWRRCRAGL